MAEKSLAYEAYQELAEFYAAGIDHKPHNAYYDRPANISLWPDCQGKRVLDAGCGPGVYCSLLVERGAIVTGVDVSDRMIELAKQRLGTSVDLRVMDLVQPLVEFSDEYFDFINAALCLDYIEDWLSLFSEFRRVLRTNGLVQFSCGHPAFEAEYYQTEKYFEIERVDAIWTGFGKKVKMPSFRRSLQDILMPVISNGFRLEKVLEPKPTSEFLKVDPIRYRKLCSRPAFLCIQARKT